MDVKGTAGRQPALGERPRAVRLALEQADAIIFALRSIAATCLSRSLTCA